MRDDIMQLINVSVINDDIGNQIKQETLKEVFCIVESITQTEHYQASQIGLKPQYKFKMSEFDYTGETLVEYNSKRYSIYRTFLRNDEHIELYVVEKVGV